MGRTGFAVAGAPLASALLALALAWATGFSQRSGLPPELDARFYGFFLERYPLYAAAIVYALARLVAVALERGPASVPRRIAGLVLGVALVLAVSLYPTFGGVALRSGFATGGIAFLRQMPMWAAYGLGAAAVAFVYGSALGTGAFSAAGSLPVRQGLRRRLFAAALRAILRLSALWFAFLILGLARDIGIGPWPRQALSGAGLAVAALLTLAAFLPHAVLVGIGARPVTGRP